jgi:DHA3 family tetracycline resistance protein-like MFS transporter
LSGITSLAMAAFLAGAMREEKFHPVPRSERKRPRLRDAFRSALNLRRKHPVLLLILSVAVFQGMSTESFDRLAPFHFLRGMGLPALGDLDPVIWFGILEGGGLLLGIIAVEFIRRRVDIDSHVGAARTLAVIDILLIVAMVAFGAADHFWVGLILFWVIALLREASDPVFTSWINQGLDPATRATVNSLWGQADAFGQVLGGPVMGLIAQARAVGTAIIVAGLCRTPALGLYVRAIRRGTVGTQPPEAMTKIEIEPGHIDVPGLDHPKD